MEYNALSVFNGTFLESTTDEIKATIIIVFILWSLIWKGFALWFSANEGKKWWFVSMLVLNFGGLLEIFYIFGFSNWGKKFWSKIKNRKNIKN